MSVYGRIGIYFWPQNIAGRISEAAMGGTGAGDLIASAVQWTEKNPSRERPKFERFYIFLGVE